MPALPFALTWLAENIHWISPLGACVYSEYLGRKSGADNASIHQVMISILKILASAFKK